MLYFNKYKIFLIFTIGLLSFSTIIPGLAFSAPRSVSEEDWINVNANSWAWNNSPQTQINKDNIENLEVKWVFPVGSKALAPAGMQATLQNEGVPTPPIVRDGVVIFETNWMRVYALDAKTGKQIWTNDYEIDVETIQERLPLSIGSPHFHGIRFWESGDSVLANGIACDFYGIDFKTGEESFRVEDLCLDLPGSIYNYAIRAASQESVGTYERGRQFIYSLNGNTGGWAMNGRNVIMGIDMDTHEVLWRVFNQPPQDQPVKDWALEECEIGWFQTYPCMDVAAQNRAGLEWDWAFPNEAPSPYGGVGSNWGQAVVDEDTGTLFLQTGNQSPYTNVSLTPGPRLYGSTIMAIDLEEGKRNWWLQPMPHDPYDYDCNWSGILLDHPQLGKAYVKGCKEGILYMLDAETGEPIWTANAHEEIYPGIANYHLTDPFSYSDLREWPFPDDGQYHTLNAEGQITLYPSWLHGTFGTDMSYDGDDTLYHYTQLAGVNFNSGPLEGGRSSISQYHLGGNVTIVARDVTDGSIKWTWFYPFSVQRSHMVVTGGMIFSGFTDGNMKFFDKDNGNLLNELPVGSGIYVGPTIGKDSDGNSKIFVTMGGIPVVGGRPAGYGGGAIVPVVPGTIIAMGLSETAAQAQTTTVTSTATTSTIVTSTTASTITEETGLPAEITYAAVAVAVIAIIAATFLMMRKK